MIGRDQIARLLPHAGAMVLLDSVSSWTDREIVCRTRSHGDPANPLRRAGVLPAICGVEYGAQAMAVHGALISDRSARPGVLASVRRVTWSLERLDQVPGDLDVHAEVLLADADRSVYAFALRNGEARVMTGQAAVFLL